MALQLVTELNGHSERVWCVRWSDDGHLLASCGADKTIRIWAIEGEIWRCQSILTDSHDRTIRSVSWSHCGNYLASVSFDATACIWHKKEGEWECTVTLEGHENEVKSVSWSYTNKYLSTCSRDKTVWIWECIGDDEFECASVQTVHTQDVKRVLWHPNKDILASCGYDNTIRIYKDDGDDWTCISTLTSHESTIWSIDFDSNGDRLASCSDDKTVKIWHSNCDFTHWKCIATLSGYHQRTIYDISWCKLSNLILTAGGDDCICIFKPMDDCKNSGDKMYENYSLITKYENAHANDVNCVHWNPKMMHLFVSGSDDGSVKLWKFDIKDFL